MTDREIVKALRKQIRIRTIADRGGTNLLILAADAIEKLERERDKLKCCGNCTKYENNCDFVIPSWNKGCDDWRAERQERE